jgi:hypothetical protein
MAKAELQRTPRKRSPKPPADLEDLQHLQQQADDLQDRLEALLAKAQKIELDLTQDFLDRFREQGLDLPQADLESIRRQLRDIRDKLRTIEGLISRFNVFKDLIELKKALIETANDDGVKKILIEQKIAEIFLKNRVLIEVIFRYILKTFELMLLRAQLPR